MKKQTLKVLIQDIEVALAELKSEVYSDIDAYKYDNYKEMTPTINDYDEVFDDDDGYPD